MLVGGFKENFNLITHTIEVAILRLVKTVVLSYRSVPGLVVTIVINITVELQTVIIKFYPS